jgi:hypothetical protein
MGSISVAFDPQRSFGSRKGARQGAPFFVFRRKEDARVLHPRAPMTSPDEGQWGARCVASTCAAYSAAGSRS